MFINRIVGNLYLEPNDHISVFSEEGNVKVYLEGLTIHFQDGQMEDLSARLQRELRICKLATKEE